MHTLEQLRSGALAGARRLDLCCGLDAFPPEIFTLADTLQTLNLSGNTLRDLPPDLGRLHRLETLFCSHNRFDHVPESVGACPQLRTVGFRANQITRLPAASLPTGLRALVLTDNRLSALPDALGDCADLQKLMLAGNQLSDLPPTLARCSQLALLRIAANRFAALPDWLLQMPRLAWIAFAGNPMQDAGGIGAAPDDAPEIAWNRLQLHERLGEGTSGVIFRATLDVEHPAPNSDRAETAVAVKLFKQALTSDGLPASEMAACLALGDHPHLLAALGRVTGHPGGDAGLVLPLVPANFQVLGLPPSLDSCTRDLYPAGLRLPLNVVLALLHGTASALAHLHARGLMHGDVYAHNILWHVDGDCRLGDLGAATPLPAHATQARALQQIEVRAFGYLAEELLERVALEGNTHAAATAATSATAARLARLAQACLHPVAATRPLFKSIHALLHALQQADHLVRMTG